MTTRVTKMDPQIVNAEGAGEVLGVSKWTILKMARKGELPGKKVGREWRFVKSELKRWLLEATQQEQLERQLEADPAKAVFHPALHVLGRK